LARTEREARNAAGTISQLFDRAQQDLDPQGPA